MLRRSNVSFQLHRGDNPNLKDYRGVMRLLYTTLRNIIEKKLEKNYFLYNKFFIYIFAYIKTFIYLCILVDVEVGLHITHEVKK